jgi:hypothetical protein
MASYDPCCPVCRMNVNLGHLYWCTFRNPVIYTATSTQTPDATTSFLLKHMAGLIGQIDELSARVAKLELRAHKNRGKRGVPGPPGPAGPAGRDSNSSPGLP